ncbi:MAG: ABC transporter ATP-binding protein [Chloroflexota bacterium]
MANDEVAKIRLNSVAKSYHTERRETLSVLKGITASFAPGEFVSIIGPSGGGKTTLLFLIAGLLPVTAGEIFVDEKPISGPGRDRGMVFQQDAILMWRTVRANVEYGLELRGTPRAQRQRVSSQYLQMVGLQEFADFYPKELSGGMKKRVQLATVFANNPEVLLMDEPFGSLDYPTKIELQGQLQQLWLRENKTALFVTHDLEEALFLSDRILALVDGEIARDYRVPLPRPRGDEMRVSTELQAAKRDLWEFLAPRQPFGAGAV